MTKLLKVDKATFLHMYQQLSYSSISLVFNSITSTLSATVHPPAQDSEKSRNYRWSLFPEKNFIGFSLKCFGFWFSVTAKAELSSDSISWSRVISRRKPWLKKARMRSNLVRQKAKKSGIASGLRTGLNINPRTGQRRILGSGQGQKLKF